MPVSNKKYFPTNTDKLVITKSAALDKNSSIEKKSQYMPSSDYDLLPMQWYQPGTTPDSWLTPKTYKETIRWVKAFCNDPYVSRIIKLKALYPLSRFKLTGIEDTSIIRFYEDMIHNQRFEIDEFLPEMALSWRKQGEVIGAGLLKEKIVSTSTQKKWVWDKMVLYDSEYVEVNKSVVDDSPVVQIELTPETVKELKRILDSNEPEDIEKAKSIDDNLKKAIEGKKKGKYLTLDLVGNESNDDSEYEPPEGFYMANHYEIGSRGYPEVVTCFKSLMKRDRLDRAQVTLADKCSLPMELWTVGQITGNPETDIIPDEDALAKIQDMIKQAKFTPPFSIVYTPLLKFQEVGLTSKLLNVESDMNFIIESILIGMGMNKNLLLAEGPTFGSNRTMALHALVMEMQVDLNRWERWMKNFMFYPIARKNQYVKQSGNEKKWMIPEIEWEKSMDVEKSDKDRDYYFKMWEKGALSTYTMYSKFPEIDFKAEQGRLEKEKNTIWDSHNRLPATVIKKSEGEEPNVSAEATPEKPVAPERPEAPKKPEEGTKLV